MTLCIAEDFSASCILVDKSLRINILVQITSPWNIVVMTSNMLSLSSFMNCQIDISGTDTLLNTCICISNLELCVPFRIIIFQVLEVFEALWCFFAKRLFIAFILFLVCRFIIRLFTSVVNRTSAVFRVLCCLPFLIGHVGWNVVSFSGLDISCPPFADPLHVLVIRRGRASAPWMKRRCVGAVPVRKDAFFPFLLRAVVL